jgi:hypothetical protein
MELGQELATDRAETSANRVFRGVDTAIVSGTLNASNV